MLRPSVRDAGLGSRSFRTPEHHAWRVGWCKTRKSLPEKSLPEISATDDTTLRRHTPDGPVHCLLDDCDVSFRVEAARY